MNIKTNNPDARLAVCYDKDLGISLLFVPDMSQSNHYHIELNSFNCRKLITEIEKAIVQETLDTLREFNSKL